jgi:hypothetical protein
MRIKLEHVMYQVPVNADAKNGPSLVAFALRFALIGFTYKASPLTRAVGHFSYSSHGRAWTSRGRGRGEELPRNLLISFLHVFLKTR